MQNDKRVLKKVWKKDKCTLGSEFTGNYNDLTSIY